MTRFVVSLRSVVGKSRFASVLFAVFAIMCGPLPATMAFAADAPNPDVIVFSNGDQLTGKLLKEANGTVTFHSDVLGDINVTWDKIKSIRSSQSFVAIHQGQQVSRKTPSSAVVAGTVNVENQQVEIAPASGAAAQKIPVKDAQYLIDQPSYDKELTGRHSFIHGWTGAVTAGASQVEATQNSRSFTAAATGVRAVPDVAWLTPQSRTLFDLNFAYGSVTSPNTPEVKTNIFHADAEQDWYLSSRLYALATASFDHNYSQGLDLQQIYGGGLGFTLIRDPKQELDLKADAHFERQSFGFTPGVEPPVETPSKNLVGIDVGDTYVLKLPHKMLFNQSLVVTPAFNDIHAFSAIFNAGLAFPVYKHFSFTVGFLDNFLNDPAFGSKKNSFQYTGGLTYSF